MKKFTSVMVVTLLLVAVALMAVACNNGAKPQTPPGGGNDAVLEITNKPAGNKLTITDESNKYQFEIGDYAGTVEWISTVTSVAEISKSGLLTMKEAGNTEVIVRDPDTQKSDSVVITVEDNRQQEEPREYELEIQGMLATVRVGYADIQLSAKDKKEGDTLSVKWSSNNLSVASVGETTGLLTIVGKGTVTVTAVMTDDASVKDSITFDVLGKAVTGVSIESMPKYGMLKSNAYNLSARVEPADADDYEIEWIIEDDGEGVASVSNDGSVTAMSEGSAKVKVTVRGAGMEDKTCEEEFTVYATDPTHEDFRFAYISGNLVEGTGLKGIGLTATAGEIVDLGNDEQNMALKITTNNDKNEEGKPIYNNVEFNFGDYEAGAYKITLRFTVLSGSHNGAIAVAGKDPHTYLGNLSYSGSIYAFIFNHEAQGDLRMRIVNSLYEVSEVLIDDITIAPYEASSDTLGDTVTFEGETDLAANGIYSLFGAELTVSEGKLNVSGGSVALFVGDVTKGRYNLNLDATFEDGYPAIAKLVYNAGADETSGVFWGSDTVALGGTEMGLIALARKSDNTYTLSFNFEINYSAVAIMLIDNSAEKNGTMTIDNLSFAKETYAEKVTIADFENGVIDKNTWNQKGKLAYSVCAYMDANTVANVGSVIDNTENTDTFGNKVYKKQSGSHYTRISFGWLEAGTYEVTVMVKVSKAVNGKYFGVRSLLEDGTGLSNQKDEFFDVTINANEWTTVTLSFTLAQTYYIKCGFASAANDGVLADANAAFYFDNFTLQKTA